MRTQFIYLLEATSGEIKIGCSVSPVTRWKTIAASSPCFVNLIAMWPGSFAEEKGLHRKFSDLRTYREWFRNEGELSNLVDARRGQNVPEMPEDIRYCGLPNDERRAALAARQSQKIRAIWADPKRREAMMWWRSLAKRSA